MTARRRAGKALGEGVDVQVKSPPRPTKRAPAKASSIDPRLAAAEQDRDALRFELDAAHDRIADLERRQAELAKRIASVLKSLHNLDVDKN
jgi:septal ring factor EnvC (AmiA/AmiB activator)